MIDRRVTLEGPVNWRDLGGYPAMDGATTKWGRLYRSDSPHTLTAADVPVLREMGIHTAVDFRSAHELEELGIGPLGDVAVRHHHYPTFDYGSPGREGSQIVLTSGIEFYVSMLQAGARAYVDAATSIANDDALPAVFYCVAGKDRTGIFAAMVLGLLGVPDEVIVADYALTHEVMDAIADRRRQRNPSLEADAAWAGIPEEIKGAHAFVMEGLLARVEETWGSWDGYADAVGIPADTVAALRDLLLDH
jgi:protein-tyrosine phosphatase